MNFAVASIVGLVLGFVCVTMAQHMGYREPIHAFFALIVAIILTEVIVYIF